MGTWELGKLKISSGAEEDSFVPATEEYVDTDASAKHWTFSSMCFLFQRCSSGRGGRGGRAQCVIPFKVHSYLYVGSFLLAALA